MTGKVTVIFPGFPGAVGTLILELIMFVVLFVTDTEIIS